MSDKDRGPPAFPSHGSMGEVQQEGMWLRDYFAANAMQAAITNSHRDLHPDKYAEFAYCIADAMLAERSKP